MKDREPSIEFLAMTNNANFERACLDQAKAELEHTSHSGIDYIHRLMARAQEIKTERLAEKKAATGVTKLVLGIDEVLQRIARGGK